MLIRAHMLNQEADISQITRHEQSDGKIATSGQSTEHFDLNQSSSATANTTRAGNEREAANPGCGLNSQAE